MTDPDFDVPATSVAIIGMSCRFARAGSPDEYWQRILDGDELLTRLTGDELRDAGVDDSLLDDPSFVPVTSLIEPYGDFDNAFFGISPAEAELMDPQHRLFMELCWTALESAGYDPQRYAGDIGVFAGGGRHAYLRHVEGTLSEMELLDGSLRGLQSDIGNYGDFLATRVSYRLGLRGPSINVQSACSTALVAVHLACQSLFLGESDIALAGGVSVHFPQVNGYLYEPGSICSPDGHLRAFDASANGSVFGNGGGVVVLRRLGDALADGDEIVAVIRGSAINNDGEQKMSFPAPSIDGQAEVIVRAHKIAGVAPDAIGYVEAHGTGTALGDPIEVAALTSAFGSVERGYCALGAVKSQIGHLGPAAGIAGLIKAALVVRHGVIPRCVNVTEPNPDLGLDESPFYVPLAARPWESAHRVAGVSAFGVGGTNAHVVIEQAPPRASRDERPARPVPVVISARSEAALHASRGALRDALDATGDRLDDVAWVLATGRPSFRYRTSVTARTTAELRDRLDEPFEGVVAPGTALPIVLAFPGQGAQAVGLGRAMYDGDPAFREIVDRCSDELRRHVEFDLRDVWLGLGLSPEDAATRLREARWAQPALFVCEYALGSVLLDAGVTPAVMVGHSVGEYAAACLAGAFALDDALELVAARGELMQSTAPGAMTAVNLDEERLRDLLPGSLDVACVNAPGQCVVSGPVAAVVAFEERLDRLDVLNSRLGTSHASHSSCMDPILDRFAELAESVPMTAPSRSVVSTLTGTFAGAESMGRADYWVGHLRGAVRFRDAAEAILARGPAVVVECGPGRALTGMFRQIDATATRPMTPWIAGASEPESAAELVAAVWEAGGEVSWDGYFAGRPLRRLPLPTYPFERSSFWLRGPEPRPGGTRVGAPAAARPNAWIHGASWSHRLLPDTAGSPSPRRVLVLSDTDADAVASALTDAGAGVTVFRWGSPTVPDLTTDEGLAAAHELVRVGEPFDAAVVAWTAGDDPIAGDDLPARVLWAVARLLAAASLRQRPEPFDVVFATAGRHRVAHDDVVRPVAALLAGAATVLPQEYPNLRAGEIDVDEVGLKELGPLVLAELAHLRDGTVAAYRGGTRYVRRFVAGAIPSSAPLWKAGGTYLVTGGLGGIGSALAEDAAAVPGVRLVLLQRSPIPAPDEWEAALVSPGTDDRLRRQLRILVALRAQGADVRVATGDVADPATVATTAAEHGPFDGIVHAAGVPGGRLVEVAEPGDVARVLRPKVQGAIVLRDHAVSDRTEWFALCSSMAAVVGGLGHLDYSGANAFLDSFAQSRPAAGCRIVALGFDAWTDAGMAVDEARRTMERAWEHADCSPFTGRRANGTVTEYRVLLLDGRDWVVTEHRLGDRGVVPGTGLVELLVTALRAQLDTPHVELRGVDIAEPLHVTTSEPTTVVVGIGEGTDAAMYVRSRRGDGEWTTHATARGRATAAAPPATTPITVPASRLAPGGGAGWLGLGPRWDNLRGLERHGADELVADCMLPERYSGDVDRHPLHPALLDMATGALVAADGGAFLPISYERIVSWGPMPAHVVSRIRRTDTGIAFQRFDVDVVATDGTPVVSVEGYTLRRADDAVRSRFTETAPVTADNRVVRLSRRGDLAGFVTTPFPLPPLRSGRVRVEVRASGLNFKEVLLATDLLGDVPADYRFGLECAGFVREVGAGVTGFAVGDPVLAIGTGCFADFVDVAPGLVAPMPPGMTFAEAATMPIAFTTAYDCLVRLAALGPGEVALIHAAAGGVGLAAIQCAAFVGANVIGTAGSERKRELVRAHPDVIDVFDSRSLDYEHHVTRRGGVDVVLNSLAGAHVAAGLRCLRHRGRFVEVGRRDVEAGATVDLSLFESGRSMTVYYPDVDGPDFQRAFADVAELAHAGVFKPLPATTFGLDDVEEAFTYMAQARHVGKVVLTRPGGDEIPPAAGPRPREEVTGITNVVGVRAVADAFASGHDHVLVTARPPGASGGPAEMVVAANVLEVEAGAGSRERPELVYDFVEPSSPTEVALAGIWGSLLRIDRVGRDDRFLDLGGDSLYGTQVVARVRSRFGVRIAPAEVLSDLALADLAALIDSMVQAGS